MNAQQVLRIVSASASMSVPALAKKFKVTEAVVERILSGESWSAISGIERRVLGAYPQDVRDAFSLGPQGLHILRPFFGFRDDLPLRWGAYDGWDGFGYAVSDGYVAWSCLSLYTYAKDLGFSELPTFSLSRVMGASIGDPVEPRDATALCAELASTHKLRIYQAVGYEDCFALLVKQTSDELNHCAIVKAAVALDA